jgi:NADH dehydrogenase
MKHVLILGAGFAGVRLARKINKLHGVKVTLVNDSDSFRYYPALYRTAVGENSSVALISLPWILLGLENVELKIGKAIKVDSIHKSVELESGEKVTYDELVCALGSVTTFFNIEGLHERAYGIKSGEEIITLRDHMESIVVSKNYDEHNYVIVGGGPTGVELAASFGAYVKKLKKKHKISSHGLKIWLVEGGDRVLPMMSTKTSKSAKKTLAKLKVHLLLSTKVTAENARGLKTDKGLITTHTVIWTAGTACNPFFRENQQTFTLNERGRVVVNHHLQAQPSIYVIGDNAAVPYSGLAYTAIKHADYVAKDLRSRMQSGKRKNHKPKAPIMVIPVGPSDAVMEYRKIALSGKLFTYLRSLADLIGYSDVMGWIKAYSIWSNSK